jgi:hypothetical protein
VDVQRREAQRVALVEHEQVVDERADPVDLAHDQRRGVARLLVARARREDLGGAADPAERVLHLVRDARRDRAVRGEPLALGRALGERAVDRAVAQREHDARDHAARPPERRGRDVEEQVRREAAREHAVVLDRGRPSSSTERTSASIADRRRARAAARRELGRSLEHPARLAVHELDRASRSTTTTPSSTASRTSFRSALAHKAAGVWTRRPGCPFA